MLVDGKWTKDWEPVQAEDEKGGFVRQASSFRHWVTSDGSAGPTGNRGFRAEPGRYHLYVSYGCPWACRALAVRKLRKLDDAISVSVVEPALTDFGWRFGDTLGSDEDPHLGAKFLHEHYTHSDPHYTGQVTVPVLWDKETSSIVNNESADILRMLNDAFREVGDAEVDLQPADLVDAIAAMNEKIYDTVNNGVYRAGFATTQQAYEEAVLELFETLDELERGLVQGGPYLLGDRLTESDIRLFVTLVRFDVAYHGIFKCNIRRIADYPQLSRHTAHVYALPGVAETVRLDHIKASYYSIRALNPSGIVPVGPVNLDFLAA